MSNDPLARLTKLLSRLPGIGEKSATRLALDLVRREPDYLRALADAIGGIGRSMQECRVCCDLSVHERCSICEDARRDGKVVCVVAHPQDRMAIEKAAMFRGRYHVLHGVLEPLAGIGPAQLRITQLLERLRCQEGEDAIEEVIIATSPSIGGDATAMYLACLLEPLGIVVSRIASGVAVGGELEYADSTTLIRAIQDRRRL